MCRENAKKKPKQFAFGFFWSEWRDLNPRPLPPQGSALPNCATPRLLFCNMRDYTITGWFCQGLFCKKRLFGKNISFVADLFFSSLCPKSANSFVFCKNRLFSFAKKCVIILLQGSKGWKVPSGGVPGRQGLNQSIALARAGAKVYHAGLSSRRRISSGAVSCGWRGCLGSSKLKRVGGK